MKPLNILLLLSLGQACASGLYPGGRSAESSFDEITDCHQTFGAKGFLKHCRYQHQATEMDVRVDSVQTLGVNYISVFAEAGHAKKRVHCQVKGSRYRAKAESLRQYDVVTIVGTAEEVSTEGDVTFIIFDECELK